MNRLGVIVAAGALVVGGALIVQEPLHCQRPPLRVDQVARIFASGGDVGGWGEFDVPEFVAAAYGARARDAIVSILSEPSTQENYYLQLEALTTSQYARVGVPVGLLLDYASGRRGEQVGGVLRQRAIAALALRPDSSLAEFWLQLEHDPDASIRQFAPAGMSCSLGAAAASSLNRLKGDSSVHVARVAQFYLRQATQFQSSGKSCGGRLTRMEALVFPTVVRPSLLERGAFLLKANP